MKYVERTGEQFTQRVELETFALLERPLDQARRKASLVFQLMNRQADEDLIEDFVRPATTVIDSQVVPAFLSNWFQMLWVGHSYKVSEGQLPGTVVVEVRKDAYKKSLFDHPQELFDDESKDMVIARPPMYTVGFSFSNPKSGGELTTTFCHGSDIKIKFNLRGIRDRKIKEYFEKQNKSYSLNLLGAAKLSVVMAKAAHSLYRDDRRSNDFIAPLQLTQNITPTPDGQAQAVLFP